MVDALSTIPRQRTTHMLCSINSHPVPNPSSSTSLPAGPPPAGPSNDTIVSDTMPAYFLASQAWGTQHRLHTLTDVGLTSMIPPGTSCVSPLPNTPTARLNPAVHYCKNVSTLISSSLALKTWVRFKGSQPYFGTTLPFRGEITRKYI